MTDDNLKLDADSIQAYKLTLPEYYPNDPECWLAQIEAQFDLYKISSQLNRYRYLVGALPRHLIPELRDLIVHPPTSSPYDVLKETLLKRTSLSEEKRLEQLLSTIHLEHRTPSQLLRLIRQASEPFTVDQKLLKYIWLKRLPEKITVVISPYIDTSSLDDLAVSADKVYEYTHDRIHNLASAEQPSPVLSEIEALRQQVHLLQVGLQNLSRRCNIQRHRSNSGRRRSISRPRNHHEEWCFYHNRFGAKARKCEQPCTFTTRQGNSTAGP